MKLVVLCAGVTGAVELTSRALLVSRSSKPCSSKNPNKCCWSDCKTDDDCRKGETFKVDGTDHSLYCCVRLSTCMDKSTKSTQGPACTACAEKHPCVVETYTPSFRGNASATDPAHDDRHLYCDTS
mmetsp:Transcript_80138/g.183621  ORF Transcript_80138/g.183621 Transcript_80138/m.183621 type:complete len:126 (+) Transcript_80138:95-472(+)|eukprot:CAMPEP_0204254228 /NCGR_PEP_ID=MMETSP0468-20130131/2426_1 /ASSEMBLY_ACC=CAM_ASM_000383 /TAXON_ID=2969 /ORGANISM="Oxyrrhis marina" /LENGTH=125 /DNA_ID=CAMNT_0051227945 /DNA_START=59 /DNA_END=436 /DNA_ORIENTATION=-